MGRKLGLRVNPKKFAAAGEKPCLKEFVGFFHCVGLNQNDDSKCAKQKDLFLACMEERKKKPKSQWSTINYHLRRLSKMH